MAGQTVTVSVLADTKRFSRSMKGLSKETGFSKLASGARKAGRVIGTVTKSIAAVGAGIAAIAIKGGFERAMNIEDAQAALKGLGHDTKSIDKIMGSALDSVKGTAFGLGDAAQIASTAVAAGIKPGEKLTQTLKLTANTAALARTGLGEMGSILNKVWTAGKVSTQELNQIADRGIPIWTSLADHYGVNATELRKMVSDGKVDAESFAEVLEGTVGTAAEEMGGTVRGQWQNMMAALSRGGESFLKGIWPLFGSGLGNITEAFDKIAPIAEKVGQAIGQWFQDKALPAVRKLGDWFKTEGVPRLKEFGDWLKREVVPRLKELGTWVQNNVVPALQNMGSWITGTLVPGLRDFGTWIVNNKDWLAALAITIGTIVLGIQTYVKVMAIWRAAVVVATAAQAAFNAIMAANPIGLIVLAIAALVAGLVYFFTQTETGQKIWAAFTDALKKGWDAIQKAFKVGWEAVKKWLQKAWDFIKKVWSYSPLGIITSNWGKITGAFQTGKDKVVGWLQNAWDFIKKVWSYSPLGLVTGNWNKIVNWFKDLPGKLMSGIGNLNDKITSPFKKAFNAVARFWNNTVGKISFEVPNWVPGMGGKGWSVPKIPMLAKGGIATRATLAMIGEGRESEAILPLSKLRALLGDTGGGGDITVNLTVNAGVGDPVAIGREVSHYLKAFETANGRRR